MSGTLSRQNQHIHLYICHFHTASWALYSSSAPLNTFSQSSPKRLFAVCLLCCVPTTMVLLQIRWSKSIKELLGGNCSLIMQVLQNECKRPDLDALTSEANVCVFLLLGPMRTSPTAPKSVCPPPRQINLAPVRKTSHVTRNGDVELIELNQQVMNVLSPQPFTKKNILQHRGSSADISFVAC